MVRRNSRHQRGKAARAVTISLRIDAALLKRVDREAERAERSRADWIRRQLHAALEAPK